MRHAIMVIGSGNDASVLQKTIEYLDDKDIDFYIHWDKKFKRPKLKSSQSKIFFINSRKVNWGSDSLVFVEHDLLREVFNNNRQYDYVHLISSSDIPLMTKKFFKNFFTRDLYLGFSPTDQTVYKRLSYYYPTNFVDARSLHGKVIVKLFKIINHLFKVDRLSGKNITINKGCQWFSIKYSYIKEILQFPDIDIFKNTFASDELYLQTVLDKYKTSESKDDCKMAARYIDWNRGTPYVFGKDDIAELSRKVNTTFAFARKVFDPTIVDKIFLNN